MSVNRRITLSGLLLVMLFFGLITPVVAETVYLQEDDLPTQIDFSAQSAIIYTGNTTGWGASQDSFNRAKLGLYILNVELYPEIQYFYLDYHRYSDDAAIPDGEYHTTYIRPSDESEQPMVVYVTNFYDLTGKYYRTRILAFPQNWDIGEKTGLWKQFILFDGIQYPSGSGDRWYKNPSEPMFGGIFLLETSTNQCYFKQGTGVPIPEFGIVGSSTVKSTTILEKTSENLLGILAIRGDGVNYYYSEYTIYDALDGIITYDVGNNNKTLGYFPLSDGLKIRIINPTIDSYNHTILYGLSESIPGDTPDNTSVNVYVQNSQTGALLADSHLSILAAAGGTETEVVNATLPGGTGTYTLQPTGGGLPNPDYYRAVATVPGFTQIIENHSFTLNGPHDVIIEMRPDTGGPADPERAYLEFYVRDLNANPIPAASIQCGGRILQTNSAGYAVFEVSKNSTHPWIAKKSGYVTIEGTATVGPNPRYVVNVVLGPGTVPTNPPATDPGGPGATPTPTPTGWGPGQWTPDPDESLGDNARGAAKQTLLEGLQAGQLLFTLCILVLIMAVLDSRRR